jgi:cytochrome c-type biogenesis protein CcmH
MKRLRTALLLCALAASAQAADTPFHFDQPEQAARYQHLTEELRCLVCQNQNLADSHADLAQDLRNEVYRMITSGQTDRQIIDFMVARYGEFVLYRPPVSPLTWLLWFGPFLLLAGAGGVWWGIARNRDAGLPDATEDAAVAALTRQDKSPS